MYILDSGLFERDWLLRFCFLRTGTGYLEKVELRSGYYYVANVVPIFLWND